jgi:FAD:protein FMN transferase
VSGHARAAVVLFAALLVALAACHPASEPETRLKFTAMGTLVDVTLYGMAETEAEAAGAAVEALFEALHAEWDPWGEGALGRLNRAIGAGEAARAEPDLAGLLARAAQLSAASGGRFEPAVGGLVRLWGFSRDEHLPEAPPPDEQIRAALAAMAPLASLLGPDGRVAGRAGLTLDLGGFAKGVAVDRAIELLRSRGVQHAIVNAGGDLRAIGRRGERPWRIGIRAPRDPGVLAAIEIEHDEALFTSGDYERWFEHQGRRYHHVLDPAGGYPARGVASVSVIHADAGLADAAATALFVAGREHWPAVAAALGIELAMVVDDAGAIELTQGMRPRVRFLEEAVARGARVRSLP